MDAAAGDAGGERMRRKIIIIMLIIAALAAVMWYSYGFFRLAIIRATIHLPLPGWILSLLWGW